LNQKVRTIRNEIQLDVSISLTRPFWAIIPETNYNVSGSFSKKIYRFTEVNTNMSCLLISKPKIIPKL
jgi:hypothetical protein